MTRPQAGKAYAFPADPFGWLVCVKLYDDTALFIERRAGAFVPRTHALSECGSMVEVGESDLRDELIASVVEHLWASRDYAAIARAARQEAA